MSQQFWESRWKDNQTGWDLGEISPPLFNYINQLTNKDLKILIPGCGNAYEAEYLYSQGFKNTYIVEIAQVAIDSFTGRYHDFPKENIIQGDFFKQQGEYDLIIEQTFFCAINPGLRKDYVTQMTKLLKKEGKLVGLLFNAEFSGGPPYGGSISEYQELFNDSFYFDVMADAINSVEPRNGRELFIILRKK